MWAQSINCDTWAVLLPDCDILRMLCHAKSSIFWHTHVTHHQVLNLFRPLIRDCTECISIFHLSDLSLFLKRCCIKVKRNLKISLNVSRVHPGRTSKWNEKHTHKHQKIGNHDLRSEYFISQWWGYGIPIIFSWREGEGGGIPVLTCSLNAHGEYTNNKYWIVLVKGIITSFLKINIEYKNLNQTFW